MLTHTLCLWAIGILTPFVLAANDASSAKRDEGKKFTYDMEGYPAFIPRGWVPKKGCNMLIQAPPNSKAWDDKAWNYVQNCKEAKAFPYCVSDQATDKQGRTNLADIANLIFSKGDGLNPAWGGNDFYVVHLHDANEENRNHETLSGPRVSIERVDKQGWIDGPSLLSSSNKWSSDKVECWNPYHFSVAEKFVYDNPSS